MSPFLSNIARRKKMEYFLAQMKKDAKILEIGCGSGWAGNYLRSRGYKNYVGLDLFPPADVVGDIKDWKKLGFKENEFDAVIIFEVIEHVDCWDEICLLLKPGGKCFATTPVPHFDWVMKSLEFIGLNQKRTSPHSNLTYLSTVKRFSERNVKTVAGLTQWGTFTK